MYVEHEKVSLSLLVLRLGIVVAMVPTALAKFYQPEQVAVAFDRVYGIPSVNAEVLYVVATLELLVLFGFLIGAHKTLSYGLVLAAQTLVTLAAWRQYLSPFEEGHLLFFTAWPMLAACLCLFLLRDYDVRLTVEETL